MSKGIKLASTFLLLILLFPVYAWATGIMMPDMGRWGGIGFISK